jgi:hypothetical protein
MAIAARPAGDTTAPVVTLVTPAAGSTTSDTTPLYSGAAGTAKGDQAAITVRVWSGSGVGGAVVQTLTGSRVGSSWSITPGVPLAAGTYTARAEQRDKAKNVGFSSANTFSVTAGSAEPVIAAAGDISCDPVDGSYNGGLGTTSNCRQLATSNLLVGSGLTRVLTLGDNQYENGALAKFQAAFEPSWGRVKSIMSPAVGNHEYGIAGAADYFTYFGTAAGTPGQGWYSYNVGSWHLIALNSNCSIVGCGAGSAQLSWLQNDLATNSAACTLAYWHHPRFSSGGEHGDSTAVQPLWQALYDANADVILSGHDHDYERFAPQTPTGAFDAARGLREFVVGTGGKSHYATLAGHPNSEIRNSDTYGVLRMTLRANGYDWQFVPAVGSFTDAGTAGCH